MNTILIMERLDRIEKLLTAQKEVLTFEEACEFTGISKSYLYKLTSSGMIPYAKPNGKMIFFERKELVSWLLQNKRRSKEELQQEATRYTLRQRRR